MLVLNLRGIQPYVRESWAVAWPMILVMFFQFSIGIADVYVAGMLGSDILAAMGYVGQLYWTLMILANAISVGTVSMVAQAYGANSRMGVGYVSANSLTMGLLVSGVMTVLATTYSSELISAAGMPNEIRSTAESFIEIFSLVLIPTYIMIISGGILRASGRVKIAMINSCSAAILNVICLFVLVFGFGPLPSMGYEGIAWSTALATTVGMILNLTSILTGPFRITRDSIRKPLGKCIKNLVRLGVPTALQQTAWNAGTLVVYFLVTKLQGSQVTALAAMAAGVRIEAIIFLPIFALNMAAAVVTGNRLGGKNLQAARDGAKATAALCLSIILIPAAAIFIFAPELSGLLTNDPEVLKEMTRYLRINMLAEPFFAVGISLSGALQGAGDTFGTMRIIFTGMWLIRIPFILFAIYVLETGPTGVWICMALSVVIMCGLLIHRFMGNKWIYMSMDKTKKTMLWESCLPMEATIPSVTYKPED